MTQINRRAVFGWMSFDWASQPYHTLLITFIFAPYFTSAVASDPVSGQASWGYATAAAGAVIALMAPILGALADSTGPRKPWIALFSVFYVIGAATLWIAEPGMADTTLVLTAFALGLIGVEFATAFSNAMLPDLAPPGRIGRISGTGWAVGYVGGFFALILVLALFAEAADGLTILGRAPVFGLDAAMREGTRAVGPLSAVWYIVFMVPFFLWLPDLPKRRPATGAVGRALKDLARTLRNLPSHRSLATYLVSSMFYRDALNGLYAFGGIYAAGVLGWSIVQIGVFGIGALIGGAIGAWSGGRADSRYGSKPLIAAMIIVLILVCVAVVLTTRNSVFGIAVGESSELPDRLFYFFGVFIGAAGGALQAASRTMLVHLADRERMTEAFGLYALVGKATAFLAPLAIAVTTGISGSQRIGVTPVIVLFLVGLVLLYWVKPGRGSSITGSDSA